MGLSISYLERTYRFVFQPKDKSKFGGKLRKAEEMTTDKKRLKFRETGVLDIYLK